MRPNTLTVTNHKTRTIEATGVDIYLNINSKIKSFNFSDKNSIHESAEELAKLTSIISNLGMESDCIHITNINYSSKKGTFSSSQSASLSVKIKLESTEHIGSLLAELEKLDDFRVSSMDWTYGDEEFHAEELVEEAIQDSLEIADNRAKLYKQKVLGIYSSMTNQTGNFSSPRDGYSSYGGGLSKAPMGGASNMAFNPSKELTLYLYTDYLIGPA